MAAMRNLTVYSPVAGLIPADTDIGAPIPLRGPFPFLSLPSEVRLKIYRFLYRSHLSIYPAIPSKQSTGSCRGELKRTTFPTSFLLTNRQIHSEASAVLWGDNKIVLQFPLNWNRERDHCSLAREKGRLQPHWFAQYESWVPSSLYLQQIQHLVIEAHLFRCTASNTPAHVPAEPADVVRRELENLSKALGNGHHIRILEVRFSNVLSSYNPNELLLRWDHFPVKHYSDVGGKSQLPWTNLPAAGCCSNFGRSAFGKKDLDVEELETLCRLSIDVDQQVLQPLTQLRAIENVRVVGRITEKWAKFLEKYMRSAPGTKTGCFEYATIDNLF